MLSIVKIISTEVDNFQRRISKFLRFGTKDIQTAINAAPFGMDSNPPADMIAVYGGTNERGQPVILGYFNKNQLAGVGEIRFFSVDGDGAVKKYIWIKADNTIEIGGNGKNMVRYQELETAFNELKGKVNDLVNAFNIHMHPTAASGPPSVPTGAGIPAQPSAANISPAKIEEVKTL